MANIGVNVKVCSIRSRLANTTKFIGGVASFVNVGNSSLLSIVIATVSDSKSDPIKIWADADTERQHTVDCIGKWLISSVPDVWEILVWDEDKGKASDGSKNKNEGEGCGDDEALNVGIRSCVVPRTGFV